MHTCDAGSAKARLPVLLPAVAATAAEAAVCHGRWHVGVAHSAAQPQRLLLQLPLRLLLLRSGCAGSYEEAAQRPLHLFVHPLCESNVPPVSNGDMSRNLRQQHCSV